MRREKAPIVPVHPLTAAEREAIVAEMSALRDGDDDVVHPPWPERSPGELAARDLIARITDASPCAGGRPPWMRRGDHPPLCPGCAERDGFAYDAQEAAFRARLA